MKGSWLAGLILIFQPLGQTADELGNIPVPPAIEQTVQHIEQLEQMLENDWTSLLGMLAGDRADSTDVLRQIDQIAQDLDRLHREFLDESLARQLGIRHLPRRETHRTTNVSAGIQVLSGDRGVSGNTVETAARLIKEISLPVLQRQLGDQPADARIVLFSTRRTYAEALLQAGVQPNMLPHIVSHTGGVTVGNDVWIPLYALQDESDLADVLTHELTHVVLNQMGIGDQLPTWINEGVAWLNGREAQSRLAPDKVAAEDEAFAQQIRQAAAEGKLVPLSAGEDEILRAPYNVEWEDYLAVQHLIQQGGLESFQAFLRDAAKYGVDKSFALHYRTTLDQYEEAVESALVSG
ncbi:MAG: hypothetical protein IRY98_08100 [Alicyclobacillaceae bacterium]|nr:hypothetical protein [Alicyclobacillaceae bacterium]